MICPGCQQEHAEGGTCAPGAVGIDPLLGKTLGDYGLVRELGRGSGGAVYLAEHLATGLNVAIKLAPAADETAATLGRRMAREARFANQIALESVVNVFDFNNEDTVGPYVVMEYVEGDALVDLTRQRMPPGDALQFLAQLADVLAEAHERNIVHAALKPTNIFRMFNEKKESVAKLLPFGVAAGPRIDGEEPGDRDVSEFGSPDFRAPEQTLGAPPDARMDVYSLGAIAYLLATGRRPFNAPTLEALVRAHAIVMPTAPHRLDVRISRPWSAVILKALEKSPESRFQSARELAEAFRAVAAAPTGLGTATVVLGGDGSSLAAPYAGVLTPAPTSTMSPPPFSSSGSGVSAGLADGFLVTTTPVPAKPPAPAGAGLADGFVTTTPAPARPPAPAAASQGVERFDPSRPFDVSSNTPRPSSPAGITSQTPAQGLVLRVMVADEKGTALGDFACSAVTRAGLIVCTSGPLPALLSRVKLVFADLDGLGCDAQVVHHVTAEQATQWKMSAGYGVQFANLSPEQRTRLESAHQGLRVPETPSGLAQRPDDPSAEETLKRYSSERSADGYAMFTISKGAPFDAIRDRVRDAKRALDDAAARPLSVKQQKALEEARARVEAVGKTLGDPTARMEYDAGRGNFEGIARCISAGLSVNELEAARLRFLKTHPGVAGKSHGSILAGQTLEARKDMAQALEAYADALRVDPLNLTAQQRYWAVRRQLDK